MQDSAWLEARVLALLVAVVVEAKVILIALLPVVEILLALLALLARVDAAVAAAVAAVAAARLLGGRRVCVARGSKGCARCVYGLAATGACAGEARIVAGRVSPGI